MNASTLAAEATRYLEAIEVFRSLELNVNWRSEAEEVRARTAEMRSRPRCSHCAGPLVRINGRHVCLGAD